MRKLLISALVGLVGAGVGAPALAGDTETDIDAVASWNGLALDAVRVTRASDADAARLYALVNVAMFDAVNGIDGHREPAMIGGHGPRHANRQAAAVAAAHAVLVRADAARAAAYDARLAADLGELGHGVADGARWGRHVGEAVVVARADDGSTPVETQPAGAGPGVFRAAWSGVQYRNVRPFAVADPGRYLPGPPPALDSAAYAAAFAEVAEVGDGRVAAPESTATYQFWSLPAGTSQPPGEWLRIALTVAAERDLGLSDEVRLSALMSMALADTTVATVTTKHTYRHWRPTTAIHESPTAPDPGWVSRAGSVGSSPEYVSGHSSYSGAGATVLAGFFRTDRIAFTHATDSAPGGVARSYPGFSAAAAEAGRSRVLGGLHFDFSNRTGLDIGRSVAREALTTSLRAR